MAERVYQFLINFVANCNISVVYLPLKQITGYDINGLFIHSDIHDSIFIDEDLPLAKKCFVLAHELGHYVLHRRYMNGIWAKSYCLKNNKSWKMRKEAEADRFAYRLLVLVKKLILNGSRRGYRGVYRTYRIAK
ncbi:protein of unknown function [Desulfotomaculum arcticum]|uniref:IrrE N-terminal-like domain-containing protein n=1 Tax=Desulfotruncus arcticus DSM 17038 TaxID=1121424 RepID=A0A1I2N410_9FIRM|nr:ImmA/IrrE family metallo-endopeptidase [Desulfotruncus arcticus]SFF97589.1 protein of unknown function [Desulfotomaculum arcticum] [Desulfotruncus arcticus DSM 17038]